MSRCVSLVEEDSVETEQESQESVDEAPIAKRPIPYHTIVSLASACFSALVNAAVYNHVLLGGGAVGVDGIGLALEGARAARGDLWLRSDLDPDRVLEALRLSDARR